MVPSNQKKAKTSWRKGRSILRLTSFLSVTRLMSNLSHSFAFRANSLATVKMLEKKSKMLGEVEVDSKVEIYSICLPCSKKFTVYACLVQRNLQYMPDLPCSKAPRRRCRKVAENWSRLSECWPTRAEHWSCRPEMRVNREMHVL